MKMSTWMKLFFDETGFLMKVELFFWMKVVLMNLYFTVYPAQTAGASSHPLLAAFALGNAMDFARMALPQIFRSPAVEQPGKRNSFFAHTLEAFQHGSVRLHQLM